jgi:uncharacterized protein YlxW (UPF0749 family)
VDICKVHAWTSISSREGTTDASLLEQIRTLQNQFASLQQKQAELQNQFASLQQKQAETDEKLKALMDGSQKVD